MTTASTPSARSAVPPAAPAPRRRWIVPVAAGALAALALGAVHLPHAGAGLVGPDVTVYDLYETNNYGALGDFRAYSLATRSCNQGDQPLAWCDEANGCAGGTTSSDHPVIAQNLYRLHDGRFTQIGMSWLKHGFFALQEEAPGCGNGTCTPWPPDFLGMGCTDPYSANLNGSRPLGRRSEVDASSGEFPFPYSSPAPPYQTFDQRIKILTADLDPAVNPGARYWVEGHYVAADDAAWGNGLNNASHREVTVSPGTFNLVFASATVRELPAIAAWQAVDPGVDQAAVHVPGAVVERFHVARKVTPPAGESGAWHYEYAIHNLNSDRSARSFTVDFPGAETITGAGFHGIAHHSGEPYSTAPWAADASIPGEVTWSTDTYAADPDANALRWGTTFSFWFDATAGPRGASHTLGLFKPGSPAEVVFSVPTTLFADGFESGDAGAWSSTVGR